MTKIVSSMATPSKEERETIISYDAFSGNWHIYSCEPKHARKFSRYVTNPQRQGFNTVGQLIMLEGDIDGGTVTMIKKRKLTIEQRKEYGARLNKMPVFPNSDHGDRV